MKTALLVGIGVVAAGGIGYLVYKKIIAPQTGEYAVSPYSYPNNAYQNSYVGAQPSEQYPYTAIVPPRVDNSSQPWYGGTRELAPAQQANLSSGMDLGFTQNVNYVKGASTIIGSISSIWDDLDLGSYFGSSSTEDSWDTEGWSWNELDFV